MFKNLRNQSGTMYVLIINGEETLYNDSRELLENSLTAQLAREDGKEVRVEESRQ